MSGEGSIRVALGALVRQALVAAVELLEEDDELARRFARAFRLREEQPTPPQPVDAAFLSAEDAATLVGVTPATVRQWVRDGKLKRYGAGRLLRVLLKDLERFLEVGTGAEIDVDERAIAILSKRRRSP